MKSAYIAKEFTPEKSAAYIALNPTYIGSMFDPESGQSLRFYEHPKLGDEAPLIIIHGNVVYLSTEWEL